MAGPVYVWIRLWNPGRECIYGDSDNVLQYLERPINGAKERRARYFEIKWIGATQAAGPEELGTAADSVADGTTTPLQITVVSASANDTDSASGHARKVALIGVSVASVADFNAGENPKLTVEVVALSGTTDVTSTRWYLRLVHAYVCDWGTGGEDAAGDITIESPADTDLQTIKAGNNESNGGTLFFADGDLVYLDRIDICRADASIAEGDGLFLTVTADTFEGSGNTDHELNQFHYQHVDYEPDVHIRNAWISPFLANVQSFLLFAEQLVANSQTYMVQCGVRLHNKAKKTYRHDTQR